MFTLKLVSLHVVIAAHFVLTRLQQSKNSCMEVLAKRTQRSFQYNVTTSRLVS